MYRGKEVCQGCGKTGADQWRNSKNELCRDCKTEIAAGRLAIEKSNNLSGDYIRFDAMTPNSYYTDWVIDNKLREPAHPKGECFKYLSAGFNNDIPGSSSAVTNAVNQLLEFVSEPRAEVLDGEFVRTDDHRGRSYRVPKHFGKVIFRLISALSMYSRRLAKESKAEGANLLQGLATGEYTTDQFNAKI